MDEVSNTPRSKSAEYEKRLIWLLSCLCGIFEGAACIRISGGVLSMVIEDGILQKLEICTIGVEDPKILQKSLKLIKILIKIVLEDPIQHRSILKIFEISTNFLCGVVRNLSQFCESFGVENTNSDFYQKFVKIFNLSSEIFGKMVSHRFLSNFRSADPNIILLKELVLNNILILTKTIKIETISNFIHKMLPFYTLLKNLTNTELSNNWTKEFGHFQEKILKTFFEGMCSIDQKIIFCCYEGVHSIYSNFGMKFGIRLICSTGADFVKKILENILGFQLDNRKIASKVIFAIVRVLLLEDVGLFEQMIRDLEVGERENGEKVYETLFKDFYEEKSRFKFEDFEEKFELFYKKINN